MFLFILWLLLIKNCWHFSMEGGMPKDQGFTDGNCLWWGLCLSISGELLGFLVQAWFRPIQNESTFDVASNRKRKRKANWGKYTKSAYGARRYGGWTEEGLLRFNKLFEEVKADWLKNGEVVEWNYINHCISNHSSPKNG